MQTIAPRPRGRPKVELSVSGEQRAALERWTRRPKTAQALALRARIVLRCAQGLSNEAVAVELGVHAATVGKWRRRFVAEGLDGLLDEPRPGAPRRIADAQVEEVIRRTLEETPQTATHWSTRSMAAASGLSQSAVSRIWRAFALQPHRIETFNLSADPLFVEKVRDVVGLYLDPPERALVLCVDEKSQIQALDRSRPTLPILPGTPARRAHDYLRHGTTSLFAAIDIASGRVTHQLHRRHRAVEFRKFLDLLDQTVPTTLAVHLILDNYATHKTPAIRRWLVRHPRFVLHFLPQEQLLAQPRRALVRRAHDQEASARRSPQRRSPRSGHHRLGRALERQSAPLRLDEDRGPGSRPCTCSPPSPPASGG
jgi:transposase